jgi:endothelin-converting enzyme
MNTVVQEPLTPLTKILLILSLALLLLSSVSALEPLFLTLGFIFTQTFIGLFAGAQHKLSLERDRDPGDHIPGSNGTVTRIFTTTEYETLPHTETRTFTETKTTTATKTQVGSTTRAETVTATTTYTTTTKVTKTANPIPIPTDGPGKVRPFSLLTNTTFDSFDRVFA